MLNSSNVCFFCRVSIYGGDEVWTGPLCVKTWGVFFLEKCEVYVCLSQLGWVCDVPLRAVWLSIVHNSLYEVWALSSFIREMVLFDVGAIGTASTLFISAEVCALCVGSGWFSGWWSTFGLDGLCLRPGCQAECVYVVLGGVGMFVWKDRWCVISVCRGVAPHTGSTKPTLFTAKSQHPIIRRDPPLPRSNKLKSLICYECSSSPSPFHLMCFYFLSVRWLVGQDLAWFPCNLSVPERMVAGRRCACGKWPSGVERRLGIEFWLRDELGNILMAC